MLFVEIEKKKSQLTKNFDWLEEGKKPNNAN